MTDHDKMVADLREWAAYHERLQLRHSAGFFNEVADEIKRYHDAMALAVDAMNSCAEYFDQRADAEYHPGSAIPETNEEMDRLTEVERALDACAKIIGEAK